MKRTRSPALHGRDREYSPWRRLGQGHRGTAFQAPRLQGKSSPTCCTSVNIIRNREKKDPAAAFDEIARCSSSKSTRNGRCLAPAQQNQPLCSRCAERPDRRKSVGQLYFRTPGQSVRLESRFSRTGERINLKPATGEAIVPGRLPDATSEDVKASPSNVSWPHTPGDRPVFTARTMLDLAAYGRSPERRRLLSATRPAVQVAF